MIKKLRDYDDNCFKGVLSMKDNKMQNETLHLAYETPTIDLIYCENEIFMSGDAEMEHPDMWQ
jgi:hypothetical protein